MSTEAYITALNRIIYYLTIRQILLEPETRFHDKLHELYKQFLSKNHNKCVIQYLLQSEISFASISPRYPHLLMSRSEYIQIIYISADI